MVKLSEIVRFTQSNKKKEIAKEHNRGPGYAREHAGETVALVKQIVDGKPGLTGKEINRELQANGMAEAYGLLARYVKQGRIKRRHQDGYWRYYAVNYKFSDEVTKETVAELTNPIISPTRVEQMKEAARHMAKTNGETQKELFELLAKEPNLTSGQIDKHLGRSVNCYYYYKQGKLSRSTGTDRTLRYSLPPKSKRKSVITADDASPARRLEELLTKEPGLTYREVKEKLGAGTNMVKIMKSHPLRRSDPEDGVYRYYWGELAKDAVPTDTQRPAELKAEMPPSSETEPSKKLTDLQQFSAPQRPADLIETLAMKYYWETNNNDLHSFVDWAKGKANDA